MLWLQKNNAVIYLNKVYTVFENLSPNFLVVLRSIWKAKKKLKLIGILSIILGTLAALFCLFPGGIIIALPIGFLGMIASSIYIFIDTRDEINTSKITPGIISMVLSSIPVLLILTFIIINHFKH